MPSDPPRSTRRVLLASLGTAGIGSLAGCATVDRLRHRRWSYDVPGRPLSAPVLAGGQALVHSQREDGTGRLVAVGRGSGEQVWVTDVPTGEHALAVTDGTVLVGGPESLVGLDVASGERRFTVETGVSDEGSFDRPAVATDADGFVVARPGGGLLALRPDGEERWRSDVPVGPPIAGGLITDAAVERPTDEGDDGVTVVGFRADSGAERWRVELDEDWKYLGGVTASSNGVHVAGEDVHSFAAGDGEARLATDLGRDEAAATPPVLAHDGEGFYVGTGVPWLDGEYGTVYPFATPPLEGFEYRTETTVTDVAVGGPSRLFAAVGDEIHAVDLESMTADWRVTLDARTMVAAGGVCLCLVGGDRGRGTPARLVALGEA